jgi:hypothetical protein
VKYESYNELEEELKNLPETFYPALIEVMVKASYKKKVWVPGGASNFVSIIEKRITKNDHPKRTRQHRPRDRNSHKGDESS